MKIVRTNSGQMIVKDSGLFLSAIFLVSAGFLLYMSLTQHVRGALFGVAFFLVCCLICFRRTTVILDSTLRTIEWKRLRLFSHAERTIPLSEVSDIVLETTSSTSARNNYRLSIVTLQESFPISDFYSSGHDHYVAKRAEILQFLGRPSPIATSGASHADTESSVLALLAQKRKVDAIRLVAEAWQLDLTEAKQRVDQIEKQMAMPS